MTNDAFLHALKHDDEVSVHVSNLNELSRFYNNAFFSMELETSLPKNLDFTFKTVDMGPIKMIGCDTSHTIVGVRRFSDIGHDVRKDHCLIYMPVEMGGTGRSWHYQGGRQGEGRIRMMTFVEGGREYRVHRPSFKGLTLVVPVAILRNHVPKFEQYCIVPHDAGEGPLSVLWDLIMSIWCNHMTLAEQDRQFYGEMIVRGLVSGLNPTQNASLNGDITRDSYLEKALGYIDTHISNTLLSSEMIAENLGIKKRYLYEVFSTHEQKLGEVIREKRLEKCYETLSNTGMRQLTVTEVAYRWGFSSYTHFSRVFKEKYGIPPRKYRQNILSRH